jgi:hypothetical protein
VKPPRGWHAGEGSTPRIDMILYNRVTPAVRKQGEAVLVRLVDYLVLNRGKADPVLPVTDLELMDWITSTSGNVKYGTCRGSRG